MKSMTRPKSHGKAHTRKKTRAKARTSTKSKPIAGAIASPSSISIPSLTPSFTPSLKIKTCEEVEVGDVGGFGSPDELEEHEKRCNEQATQFCATCAKNLCSSHYDLLHKDHDNKGGHNTGQGMVQV